MIPDIVEQAFNASVTVPGGEVCIMNFLADRTFFNKYTATHEQVTRSAPVLEPDDTQNPNVNTRENTLSNASALQAKKESKLKKSK